MLSKHQNRKNYLNFISAIATCFLFTSIQADYLNESNAYELEQFNLGQTYQITKYHTENGNLVHFDSNSSNPLYIQNINGKLLADVSFSDSFSYECTQILGPVIYNISDESGSQASITISCGDAIKIREIEK